MSISCFGGATWKWYLSSSCSLGLRERAIGICTCTVSDACCHIFFRYDHLNYARWGSAYIAEMEQLPQEVLEEFKKGNFVVKWKASKFNQVSPDHSLEWLNGIGKRGGGIVSITKTSSALSRWELSCNLQFGHRLPIPHTKCLDWTKKTSFPTTSLLLSS